jgi:hypothetical protein
MHEFGSLNVGGRKSFGDEERLRRSVDEERRGRPKESTTGEKIVGRLRRLTGQSAAQSPLERKMQWGKLPPYPPT